MAKEASADNSFGVASVVLAIVSIVLSLNIIAILSSQICGLVLGVVAFIFAMMQKKRANNKWARAGFILSIIGAVLNLAIFIWIYLKLIDFAAQFQAQMQQLQQSQEQLQAAGLNPSSITP